MPAVDWMAVWFNEAGVNLQLILDFCFIGFDFSLRFNFFFICFSYIAFNWFNEKKHAFFYIVKLTCL